MLRPVEELNYDIIILEITCVFYSVFNLVHYTIFGPEMVNFIPIYRYFDIYDIKKNTDISVHWVQRVKLEIMWVINLVNYIK